MQNERLMQPGDELVTRAQAGDMAAFATLYERQQDRLYRLALVILGNEETAADVVQDAFVKIFEQIGRFRHDSSFSTWTTTIVVNLCRSKMQRRKIIRFFSLDVVGERRSSADVEQTVALRQRRQKLQTQVQQLNEKHRLPVVLHYYERLSCEEIAAVLNIPVNTVYSRLRTARKQLRDLNR